MNTTALSSGGCNDPMTLPDIDILILPGGRGRGATSTLMKNMVGAIVAELPFRTDLSRHKHETSFSIL